MLKELISGGCALPHVCTNGGTPRPTWQFLTMAGGDNECGWGGGRRLNDMP